MKRFMQVHFTISKFMKRLERAVELRNIKTTMFLLLDYYCYYDFCSQKRDYTFSLSLSFAHPITPFPFLRCTNRNFISTALKESIMSSLVTFTFVWHLYSCFYSILFDFMYRLHMICACLFAVWFVCMQCAFHIT